MPRRGARHGAEGPIPARPNLHTKLPGAKTEASVVPTEPMAPGTEAEQPKPAWRRLGSYLIDGPAGIRRKLREEGPVEASLTASAYSATFFVVLLAFSVLSVLAVPCAILLSVIIPSDGLDTGLGLLLALPAGIAALVGVLSGLAAFAIGVAGILAARDRRAAVALLISTLLLAFYAFTAMGVIALAG